MQKLNYDYYNNIEVPTFVLSNVYHHHIGVINNIDIESIQYSFNMNARQEVSFDIYKELNGEKCDLWDKIIDLKYVYIPEHDEYYVLAVSTDDSDNTVKHCSLTSAGEYELSNKIIRSLEINTESDILRNVDDASKPPNPPYAPNVLCNFDDPDNSILHRALKDKAPDWSVAHCDETIAHIQRTFTVTNQKIYDFLTGTLAKEYDCLFQFDSVNRTISCYDLLNICEDCGERGEFVYECPNCGSKKIHYGYGKNTNIFITYNNFSEKITRDGDEGAVKNCFHVTGGDDYINSTIRNINPNGSPYIYNFSQQDYEDMPPALVEGLEAYQAKYDELYEPYQEVTAKWYDAINNYYFYKTSMMPRSGGALWEAEKGYNLNDETYVKTLASWAYLKCVKAGVSGTEEFDATNVLNGQIINDGAVQWQVCKNIITPSTAEQSYNDIVTYFQSNQIYFLTSIPTTLAQVNNEVINISQLQINNLYKVDVVSDGNNKVEGTKWYGRLKVTNSGNAEDTYKSDVTLEINLRVVNAPPEYVSYMEDKVVKRINRSDKTFINLYELDNDTEFKLLLTQYGLDSLSSFSKSYQNCIDVLIANGIKDENSQYMGFPTYEPIYLPTYNRKTWVDEELAKREATVKKWENLRDDYRKAMDDIQNQLDLTNFLSDDLLRTFYNYIREDTYTNSNYISTGLSDGEVINNAKELLKVAEKELKKASELQVTLNDTIKNLLNTDEFKNYKDKYNLGDFIFVECDGDDWEDDAEKNRGLYRLRLISASYSFGSPGDINFTFSNVTKVQNFFSDAQSVINSAQTISGSYNAVVHQVKNNSDTTDLVNTWTNEGLESAKSIIANNNNEEVTMGEYGIYAKEYDDIKDEYSPEQLRITHNNITFTDDNWETAALAIGKNTFRYYNTDVSQGAIGWITKTDYGVNAKFLEAGYVIGGQIIGSEVVSKNYQVADPAQGIKADGSYINLDDGSFTLAGGGLIGYRNSDGTYYLNYNGNFTGIVDVDVGSELGVWTVGADGFYSGTSVLKPSDIAVTGNIRAADFYVGTSTTTTLSSILNGKQDILIPGTNITIDPTTNTISASSGTEVEANPSGTPTDTLTTIEIDNTIYDIDGGTDVEANPVETATDTLNSIKIDDTVYDIAGGGDVNLHYGAGIPTSDIGDEKDIYLQLPPSTESLYEMFLYNSDYWRDAVFSGSNKKYSYIGGGSCGWEFIGYASGRAYGLDSSKEYTLHFDVIITGNYTLYNDEQLFGFAIQERSQALDFRSSGVTPPTNGGQATNITDRYGRTATYQSFYTDKKKHTYEITFRPYRDGENYLGVYFDKCADGTRFDFEFSNIYITDNSSFENEITDVFYKIDGEWLEYEGGETYEAGDNITIVDNVISATDTKYTAGSNVQISDQNVISATDTDEIAELEDVSLTNLADGQILKYNATTQKWENAEDSGGSEVEANPSGTATDTLTKLGIDGTIYEIQGGGGGTGGSSVYSEKQLYKASVDSFQNISVTWDWDEYDAYIFSAHDTCLTTSYKQNGDSTILTKAQIKNLIDTELKQYIYRGNGYTVYVFSDSTITANANSGGFFITEIIGLKFGTLSPIIYSTEEREIGVWTDDKPLYAKTYNFNSFVRITNSGADISQYIDNRNDIEILVRGEGFSDDITQAIHSTALWVGYSTRGVIMAYCSEGATVNCVTLYYTKTTDVAGSGSYTTLGVPAHHYDSNEKVVGTWFGETLYEKTLVIHNESTVSSTTTITTIDSTFRVKNWKAFAIEYGVNYQIPYVAGSGSASFYFRENGNVDFTITNTSFAAGSDFYITIEYTKSTT